MGHIGDGSSWSATTKPMSQDDVEVLSKFLSTPITSPDEPTDDVQPAPIQPVTDTADAIRKYKGLLDDGIITQAEFDAKKKELLDL
nr:SHOCT domain-containing protein [Lacticaseibacillus nasuensis]